MISDNDLLWNNNKGERSDYDVTIIGAGPAGLFSARALVFKNKDNFKIKAKNNKKIKKTINNIEKNSSFQYFR